jgi:hypothetical protein
MTVSFMGSALLADAVAVLESGGRIHDQVLAAD